MKTKTYKNIVGNDYLRKNIKLMNQERKRTFDFFLVITGYERNGKCEKKGSKVLMANGKWKNVEDIKIGEYVLSPQKNESYVFAKVLQTNNWWCDKVYDVCELNKKHRKLYSCSYNHSFPINRRYLPTINGKRSSQNKKWNVHHYTAKRYSKLSPSTKTNMTTLTAFPITKFKGRRNCVVEPYTLGIYLGDGSFCSGSLNITTSDFCVMNEILKYYDVTNVLDKDKERTPSYRFSTIGKLAKQLISLDLKEKRSGVKFIPKQALLSDLKYRKKLLAGLIDSDGYYSNGGYSIVTKSKQLAEDMLYLIHTLGGRGVIRRIKKGIKKLNFWGIYYDVQFYMGNTELPMQIKRKKRNGLSTFYLSSNRVSIDVKETKPCQVYGFALDSPSKWYVTDNFMVTHNSTMALQICKEANPNFSIKDIAFNVKQFSEKLKAINERAGEKDYFPVLMYDEAGQGLYNRLSGQKDSMAIALLNTVLMQVGFLRGLFVLILPNFFVLDNYVREHRITALIHIYKRGSFIAFEKKRVELISVYGKSKQIPYFIKPNFSGTFTKYNPLGKDYFKAELKNKQNNISSTLNKILNTFKTIKNKVVCPRCNSSDIRYIRTKGKIQCRKCGKEFTMGGD